MARFVHVTALKQLRSIRRAGLKADSHSGYGLKGLYAMPVVPNYYRSHQWVRELKRNGQRQMYGVYFQLADDATVFVGRYNQAHHSMRAAEAVAYMLHTEDVQGVEVFIPFAIAAQAITAIRALPHIGWRYFPHAHGQRPCACPVCLRRGEIKSRRIRAAYGSKE